MALSLGAASAASHPSYAWNRSRVRDGWRRSDLSAAQTRPALRRVPSQPAVGQGQTLHDHGDGRAYLGELIIRATRGRWGYDVDLREAVVETGDGVMGWPHTRVAKHLEVDLPPVQPGTSARLNGFDGQSTRPM